MTSRTLLVACVAGLAVPSSAQAYEPRHVFITNRGGGNIVELDETFAYQRTWFEGSTFEGSGLAGPNGMAFTPDGSLFVADTSNQRIVALDASGGFVRAFSTAVRMGSSIESIYFDGTGVMFASANPGLGVVARYSQTGAELPDVVSAPAFLNLGNVNLTEAGDVVVSDFSAMGRGLRELDAGSGAVLRTFGTDLGLQEDVMIDGGDRIFVSHFAGDEIVVFGPAPTRTELYRFTAPAGASLPLVGPTGIALTHDCYLLVASFASGGIFVFRHQGDTAPTFERVLQPGVEIPAEAMLADVESIAISALGLPGSFDEFADRVPSCDEPPAPDAGPIPDAGPLSVVDASAPPDAAPTVADAGRRGGAATSGCGCRAGSARSGSEGAAALSLAALGLLAAGWRSARSRR